MSIKTCIKSDGINSVCGFFEPKDAPKLLPKITCKHATKKGCGVITLDTFDLSDAGKESFFKALSKKV